MDLLDDLYSRRRELLDIAHSLKADYEAESARRQPEIDRLQAEADALAAQWVPMVQESQAAYHAEDYERANSLSAAYKPLRDECRAKNDRTNALRSELGALSQAVSDAFAAVTTINDEIERVRKGLPSTHGVEVEGFAASGVISDSEVADLVAALPEAVWQHVESLRYVNHTRIGGRERRILRGYVERSIDTCLAPRIIVCKAEAHGYKDEVLHTIAHESGHVVWERILNPRERSQWEALHRASISAMRWPTGYARESPEELFCESWALYARASQVRRLQRHFPMLHNEIASVTERLK